MRVVLFTGKGGVGKTTAAAATAALLAARGRKALVVSTDPAHSLADALGMPLGPRPVEIDPGLAAMQVDAQRRFEAGWSGIRDWLGGLLRGVGVDGLGGLAAQELPVPPGAAEVCALLEVRDQVAGGPWDAVLVDCAPTAETLRLLALPEALAGYVERVWPAHRRVVRSLRPVLGRLAGDPPLPPDEVLDAMGRLHAELTEVRALLTAPGLSSVRLVLTPEAVVVAEARRTLTALALHGYAVDSVIANRVFPPEAGDSPWATAWRAAQASALAGVAESLPGLPVRQASYRTAEPVGVRELLSVAVELYGADDPLAPAPAPESMAVRRDGGDFVLRVALPFVQRSEVQLARSGDELVVTVGGQRRRVALPSVLRRCVAVGAAAGDGAVQVRFRPDPDLWPRELTPAGSQPGRPR